MAKLTEKLISATNSDNLIRLWDSDVAGFGIDIRQRRKTFFVRGRVNGKQVRANIGIWKHIRPDGRPWTVTLARQRARELVGQFAAGVKVGGRTGGPTLRDGMELHLRNMRKKKRTARSLDTFKKTMIAVFPDWLDRPLAELTGERLVEFIDNIMATAKPRAGGNPENAPGAAKANRAKAQVSACWKDLNRERPLPFRNPAEAVISETLKSRETRINDGEFGAWYSKALELTPIPRDVHLTALFTSVRSDGVRHFRHEDINHRKRTGWVSHAKGCSGYTIPLSKTSLEIFKTRRKENAAIMEPFGGDGGWVFPTLTRSKPFQVIPCQEPKRPGLVSLHDLRRTWNSVAGEIGVPKTFRNMIMNQEQTGVNDAHYSVHQSFGMAAEWQAKVDAAIWKRIRTKS